MRTHLHVVSTVAVDINHAYRIGCTGCRGGGEEVRGRRGARPFLNPLEQRALELDIVHVDLARRRELDEALGAGGVSRRVEFGGGAKEEEVVGRAVCFAVQFQMDAWGQRGEVRGSEK